MTQTIESLQARLAELEDENAKLLAANRDCIEHFNAMQQDLAAAQLQIKTLREALYRIALTFDDSWMSGCVERNMGVIAEQALTQPTSTEALDAYVAEKMKEAMK